MHGAKCMLKPGMLGRRVGIVCEAKLEYPPQPLKEGMLYYIEDKCIRNGNETINRVIDDLLLIGCVQNRLNLLKKYKTALPAQ